MNNHSAPFAQESRELLAAVVACHSVKISDEGTQLLLKGYAANDPALRMQGLRLLMFGNGLMGFAPLIEAGIMSETQFMEYLDKRGV